MESLEEAARRHWVFDSDRRERALEVLGEVDPYVHDLRGALRENLDMSWKPDLTPPWGYIDTSLYTTWRDFPDKDAPCFGCEGYKELGEAACEDCRRSAGDPESI